MDYSVLNDYSNLIQDSPYIFRKLDVNDSQAIQDLFAESFPLINPVLLALNITKKDTELYFKNLDLNIILNQNMSYGAFHNNTLISMAITMDQQSNCIIDFDGNTPQLLEYYDGIEQLRNKFYKNHKKPNIGEIGYVFILATRNGYLKQNLCTAVFYLSVKEMISKGYKLFVTEAEHIGIHFYLKVQATKKVVQKVFQNSKIEAEHQIKNVPVLFLSCKIQKDFEF